MKLAMLVNPFTDTNLPLAAQVGVTEVVIPYPGLNRQNILEQKRRAETFGMRLKIIERKLPHLQIVHGLDDQNAQIEDI